MVVLGERRPCFWAFAANRFKSKNIRIYCFLFFLIPSNLSPEALFNVLPLFEMQNSSAAIIIQMQRGHETFCLVQPCLDHFVPGVPTAGWGCPGHVLCKIMFFPLFYSSLSCNHSSFSSENREWGGCVGCFWRSHSLQQDVLVTCNAEGTEEAEDSQSRQKPHVDPLSYFWIPSQQSLTHPRS